MNPISILSQSDIVRHNTPSDRTYYRYSIHQAGAIGLVKSCHWLLLEATDCSLYDHDHNLLIVIKNYNFIASNDLAQYAENVSVYKGHFSQDGL